MNIDLGEQEFRGRTLKGRVRLKGKPCFQHYSS